MVRKLFIAFAVILSVIAMIFLVGWWSLSARLESSLFDQSALSAGAADFLDAQRYVESQPELDIFLPQAPQNQRTDAGGFLNSLISWYSIDSHLIKLNNDWYREPSRWTIKPDDVAWFGELHRFDHWNLESQGPLADYLQNSTTPQMPDLPSPHWRLLRDLLRQRLVQGIQSGQLPKAVEESRHFTALVASTESMIANLMAIAMLKDIEKVDPSVVKRSDADWHRVKTAVYGIAGYFRLGLDPDLKARVFADPAKIPGLCGAINERAANSSFELHLVGPFYPRQFQELNELYERLFPYCQSARGKRVWRNRQQVPKALEGDIFAVIGLGELPLKESAPTGNAEQWQLVTSIPILHRLLGLILANIANTNFDLGPMPQGEERSQQVDSGG